jgi:cytosine/adenosine deaminase-related metal-dependent hydrolase
VTALGPDATGRLLVADDDRIVHCGPAAGNAAAGGASLACEDGRLEPGRINAHTHLYSGLTPLGMPRPAPPPPSFSEILERVWWRLDRALDEEALAAAARFYAAEALLAGTTAIVDHHESPRLIEGSLDVVADACQELGLRAVVCYGASERNGGRDEARRGLAECRRFILANRRPLVRGVVGLHAGFTVSDETLREAGELCRELDTVLHVHLAEDTIDGRAAARCGYAGPLERLLALDALPAGSILAHGVHLAVDQVRRTADLGHWIVQNPRSNRGNGVGYPAALGASARVALGTDGYPARMDEEAAALRAEAAAHGEDDAVVERRLAAGHALMAERFGKSFAPLRAGGVADAVAIDAGGVRHVLVGGRPVVSERRLRTADRDTIRAAAERQAARLWRRMATLD